MDEMMSADEMRRKSAAFEACMKQVMEANPSLDENDCAAICQRRLMSNEEERETD